MYYAVCTAATYLNPIYRHALLVYTILLNLNHPLLMYVTLQKRETERHTNTYEPTYKSQYSTTEVNIQDSSNFTTDVCAILWKLPKREERGGGLGSSTIFKKFNETYAPS